MNKEEFSINNEVVRQHVLRLIDSGKDIKVTIEDLDDKTRTGLQNSAMHVFFSLLSKKLNDSGFDMKKVLAEKQAEIPWSDSTVKECLWRPIQLAITDKKSTTKLDTSEVSKIYSVLMRHLSQLFGVYVEFPSKK